MVFVNEILNLIKIIIILVEKFIENSVRFSCWKVDQRGACGETPLHLCLLVGSTLHKELAKRLIKLFPALVNDIYLSDEYYGSYYFFYIV